MRIKTVHCFSVLLAVIVLTTGCVNGLMGVEYLPGGKGTLNHIESSSRDGRVLVGYGDTFNNRKRAFRIVVGRDIGLFGLVRCNLTDRKIVPIELPQPDGFETTRAFDVSWRGDEIVGNGNTPGTYGSGRSAIVWKIGDHPVILDPEISSRVTRQEYATAISDDGGAIVGYVRTRARYTGFLINLDKSTTLTPEILSNFDGVRISDVSEDGNTIVGDFHNDEVGFVRVEGVYTDIKSSDGAKTVPTLVSSNGQVVAGVVGQKKVFRWTASEKLVPLPDLPGSQRSRPEGISADGSVIVGSSWVGSNRRAFIWDANHGTRDLNDILFDFYGPKYMQGWVLETAYGVSYDNWMIYGYGTKDGQRRAWVGFSFDRLLEGKKYNRYRVCSRLPKPPVVVLPRDP